MPLDPDNIAWFARRVADNIASRSPERYAAAHAPKTMTIGGVEYKGGEFIPGDVVAKATPAEKAKLKPKAAPTKKAPAAKATPKAGGKAAPKPKAPAKPKEVAKPKTLAEIVQAGRKAGLDAGAIGTEMAKSDLVDWLDMGPRAIHRSVEDAGLSGDDADRARTSLQRHINETLATPGDDQAPAAPAPDKDAGDEPWLARPGVDDEDTSGPVFPPKASEDLRWASSGFTSPPDEPKEFPHPASAGGGPVSYAHAFCKPLDLHVRRNTPHEQFSPGNLAAMSKWTGDIILNLDSHYWRDPEVHQEKAFQRGWMSSAHPGHVVHHEAGHALHLRNVADTSYGVLNQAPPTPAFRAMARRDVSGYAATSYVEFVAEVFAGRVAGRKFPPRVMDLYRELKGPCLGSNPDDPAGGGDKEKHASGVAPERYARAAAAVAAAIVARLRDEKPKP